MMNVRKLVAGSLLGLSVMSAVIPTTTRAGVVSDGVTSSNKVVQQDTNGYYAYGYVTTRKSHTTTAQLKHSGKVIYQKTSAQDTGKVSAKTKSSNKYSSGWKAAVLYRIYE